MLNKLENKLEEIRSQKERALVTLHSLIGAEQVILQLIEEIQNEKKVQNAKNND